LTQTTGQAVESESQMLLFLMRKFLETISLFIFSYSSILIGNLKKALEKNRLKALTLPSGLLYTSKK